MIKGFHRKTIKTKSLGDKLIAIRLRQEKDLFEAEDETKVRVRYLEAFESDDYSNLPDEVYAIGFLTRYLDFLGINNQSRYITEFKRSLAAWKSLKRQALTPVSTIKETKVLITPKLILGGSTALVVLMMFSYIWLQVRHLTAPPTLTIITPTESTKIAIEKIDVTGKTDPGATVAINNQIVHQDKEGNFKEQIALQNGVNTIEVVATNRFQKSSTKTLKVLKTNIPI